METARETTTLHGFAERDAFGRRNRPAIEQILQDNLGIGQLYIRWIEPTDEDFQLDQRLGIDAYVEGPGLGRLTCQVKTMSTDYRTVTIENWEGDGQPGDLWTNTSSLYVSAYCDGDGNAKRWVILDWSRLILAGLRRQFAWRSARNGDGRARSEFVWCPFSEIMEKAPESIVASGGNW